MNQDVVREIANKRRAVNFSVFFDEAVIDIMLEFSW